MMADDGPVPPLPLYRLAWVFLRIGATAYGGFGAALAMVEREFVGSRRWLSEGDLTEALAAARLLPGPTVVQVVAHVGYVVGGWSGSAVATSAFLAPSVTAMGALAALYGAVAASPAAGPALGGLSAAVVGLVLATGQRLARSGLRGPRTAGLAVAAFAAGAGWGANAAAVVAVAGLVGAPLLADPGVEPPRGGGGG